MRKNVCRLLMVIAAAAVLTSGCKGKDKSVAGEAYAGEEDAAQEPKKLILWYTQPDLEGYFQEAAAEYEAKSGTVVEAVQMPALDYIERINKESVEDTDYPDLYVATTDQLEKASLAGLTSKADQEICSAANFPQKALDAVTYKGKKIAYPFYSDTSVLVYNRNYVQEAPETVEDIQRFSEEFEGDGYIQNIFVWNVNDIFVDFFSIGNYVNLGGPYGDSLENIVLYSDKIQACLGFYQELSQFFAIDRELVSEEQIVKDFAEGKTVYAIIRDDSIAELDLLVKAANEASEGQEVLKMSYGISTVPDLTADLQVKPLSITHTIVVNGYSANQEEAEKFAGYLSVEKADRLYETCGNFPIKKGVSYDNPDISQILAQYEEAVEVPKVMQMSNYWLIMEQAFADIWTGEDTAATMEEAQELMNAALGI